MQYTFQIEKLRTRTTIPNQNLTGKYHINVRTWDSKETRMQVIFEASTGKDTVLKIIKGNGEGAYTGPTSSIVEIHPSAIFTKY
ncbi:hypothetical protein MJO28_014683 [Puccinia striiformis f. sp. tritici]|uniref:Uncharacterized protein n=1 Tax=Puccinia striiformis f. sp. tritici TaxID=168172 RepID=A0ACC0DVP5_9BASI|nr:hypothetical protein MJO29_016599 [Puccinia striiformis f. sp. tritici]KAI7939104.1 hypothetical protein MJO28_014683 [Puccinia striiformis f. sp. tritici]KAI9621066.1 hypothetical protein H4Q26_013260 [Puccinia striiformis f. sp. tritici PST-130]